MHLRAQGTNGMIPYLSSARGWTQSTLVADAQTGHDSKSGWAVCPPRESLERQSDAGPMLLLRPTPPPTFSLNSLATFRSTAAESPPSKLLLLPYMPPPPAPARPPCSASPARSVRHSAKVAS